MTGVRARGETPDETVTPVTPGRNAPAHACLVGTGSGPTRASAPGGGTSPDEGRGRVVLTHATGRLEGLPERLRALGFDVVHQPAIAVRPRTDAATRAAAASLLELPWLLFASRSAVEAWRALGVGFERDPASSGSPRIGAVGPGTAAALRAAGARVDLVAEPSTAEGLASAFTGHQEAAGPVGLARGNRARPTLADRLSEAGYATRAFVLYDTESLAWNDEPHRSTNAVEPTVIVVASPSAVASLPLGSLGEGDADEGQGARVKAPRIEAPRDMAPRDRAPGNTAPRIEAARDSAPGNESAHNSAPRIVAIGPTTAAAVRALAVRCEVAETADVKGIVSAVVRAADGASERGSGRTADHAAAHAPEHASDRSRTTTTEGRADMPREEEVVDG